MQIYVYTYAHIHLYIYIYIHTHRYIDNTYLYVLYKSVLYSHACHFACMSVSLRTMHLLPFNFALSYIHP